MIKITAIVFYCILLSCSLHGQDLTLDKSLVHLKGQISTTVIKNSTSDTLKFSTRAIYYLPYYETNSSIIIPPGNIDSLLIPLAYPDYLFERTHDLRFYIAPGKRIVCDVYSLRRGLVDIRFSGDLHLENDYYRDYQNQSGYAHETRLYYSTAGKLQNLENFPAIADSINNLSLMYLNSYNKPLPGYFKAHETARLNYNAAFRKYNVLFDREFRTGTKNSVSPTYFDFVNSLPLIPDKMYLNASYLEFMDFSIFFRSGQSQVLSRRVATLDNLMKPTELRDAIKMKMMSHVYQQTRSIYDSIMPRLSFFNNQNKYALDSITTLKSRLPIIGRRAPSITLVDIKGDSISLASFKGKPVIINFWASWCAPCLKEFHQENFLYSKYGPQGLVIINICVDTDRKKWESLTLDRNLKMVNLFTTEKEYARLKSLYNIEGLPRTILDGMDQNILDNYYKRASDIMDEEILQLLTSKK